MPIVIAAGMIVMLVSLILLSKSTQNSTDFDRLHVGLLLLNARTQAAVGIAGYRNKIPAPEPHRGPRAWTVPAASMRCSDGRHPATRWSAPAPPTHAAGQLPSAETSAREDAGVIEIRG